MAGTVVGNVDVDEVEVEGGKRHGISGPSGVKGADTGSESGKGHCLEIECNVADGD